MTLLPDAVANWRYREPAAGPAAISALSAAASIELPEEYLSLLALTNGGSGPLAVEPGWFRLWPVEQVLSLERGTVGLRTGGSP